MELYLVRHGQARRASEDPERGLTEFGIRQAEATAGWAAQAGATPIQIWHSGKARAEQTAAIFARHLRPSGGVVDARGLSPNDDVTPVAGLVEAERESLMIVGHLPFLPRLASLLLTGDPDRVGCGMAEASVVCLAHREGRWFLQWMVTPREAGLRE